MCNYCVSYLSFFPFFFVLFTLSNVGITPPGDYNPNARWLDAHGNTDHGTLDQIHKDGLPEFVDIASARDNTGQNTKDTHPIPGQKLKFLTPPGVEPGSPGCEVGTTDHATTRDLFDFLY